MSNYSLTGISSVDQFFVYLQALKDVTYISQASNQ